ncbi:phage integrase N-terminal SAM-like domain-containing protein [Limosilactobacillus difficilis]|uniref:phage integrase N-terminal SAM-like domain-containing protein n=1 Tax=Limosilactobacillus difficilis TaxID=2991838 RepID=UPI0024BA2A37|nr:phage integrase N-terminal SAM-like domain-containing protein [Limosilactobacillus difficilis]
MQNQQYPYQTSFELYLKSQQLSQATIITYSVTVAQLFKFLMANRPQALQNGPRSVNTADVRAYFDYLEAERRITLASYNKTLAQVNRYFTYLFTHQLSTQLPTLLLHGQQIAAKPELNLTWLGKMDAILMDNHLHHYSRLTLLLLGHGYTVKEFLQPGFYRVYRSMKPTFAREKDFRRDFAKFIKPLQDKQNSADIFLKKRFSPSSPNLTNPALHKYLKSDEEYLGFAISPAKLHQSYICWRIQQLHDKTDQEIEDILQLDPQSLIYFKKLLLTLKTEKG